MTATPIPRTVTMTLFGDLEVSTLRDSPPGRQKVHTYLADEEKRDRWWEFFRKQAPRGAAGLRGRAAGRGIGPARQPPAWRRPTRRWPTGELEAFRLGLIHGRMTRRGKGRRDGRFRRGEIQVLVCTSVVEVGVDVPNATLMTIESGERFGLAQLHQLRGRISRGQFPGFCCVFADAADRGSPASG